MLLEVIKATEGEEAAGTVAAEWLVADKLGATYSEATDRERYEAARAIIATNADLLIKDRGPSGARSRRHKEAQFVRDLVDREPALLTEWAATANAKSGDARKAGQPHPTDADAADARRRLEAALAYHEATIG